MREPALLELPTDHPRPALQSHAGGAVGIVLSAELSNALRAFSQRQLVQCLRTGADRFGWQQRKPVPAHRRISARDEPLPGVPIATVEVVRDGTVE